MATKPGLPKVVVTRPQHQARVFGASLEKAGYTPVFFPVFKIQPIEPNPELDQALTELIKYSWVVFTSANAVQVVFEHWQKLVQSRKTADSKQGFRSAGLKVAAIGPKTEKALRGHGIACDFVPDEYVAEAIMPGLGNIDGQKILIPRAAKARQTLPDMIREAGGTPHTISLYTTQPESPAKDALQALQEGVDWLTFTSPSTIENFVAIVTAQGLNPAHLPGEPRVACIGPITEAAAARLGFRVTCVATSYTQEGLVQAIKKISSLAVHDLKVQ